LPQKSRSCHCRQTSLHVGEEISACPGTSLQARPRRIPIRSAAQEPVCRLAMTRYRRGRRLEYLVRDKLTELGYFAIRAAGSKGLVDVVGIGHDKILFVQCKRSGVISSEEWNALLNLARACKASPILARRPKSGRGVEFVRLLTPRAPGQRIAWVSEPFSL